MSNARRMCVRGLDGDDGHSLFLITTLSSSLLDGKPTNGPARLEKKRRKKEGVDEREKERKVYWRRREGKADREDERKEREG